MKRYYPLALIIILGLTATLSIIPGCDKLVTEEKYYYDTHYDTFTIYEADTTCGVCHNDATDSISIAKRQWAYSRHASDSLVRFDYLGRNTSTCGPECHTNEGFVDLHVDSVSNPISFPTEIGCFTCHAPHTERDFSLRTVTLAVLEEGNFNKGNSNICAKCHKATLSPPIVGGLDVDMDSTWGPHFSVQADMLLGVGGYEFSAPQSGANPHYNQNAGGCLTCHQDATDGFKLGGHSENIVFDGMQLTEACNAGGCHDGAVTDIFTVDPGQQELIDSLAILYSFLVPSPDSATAGHDTLLEVTGGPRLQTLSPDSAGIIFNYLFVTGDGSDGTHNLGYAKELIDTSIARWRSLEAAK